MPRIGDRSRGPREEKRFRGRGRRRFVSGPLFERNRIFRRRPRAPIKREIIKQAQQFPSKLDRPKTARTFFATLDQCRPQLFVLKNADQSIAPELMVRW